MAEEQAGDSRMSRSLVLLLVAQFLSAFADNAVLFAVIEIIMQATDLPSWYKPALQAVFLLAFVIFAPWLGGFTDNHNKARVLIIGNGIKALGAGLLLFSTEPLLAYAVVGLGAAVYGPAKYGILPDLVDHQRLVKANSWIEGSTILAILLGMLVGAKLAVQSIDLALMATLLCYGISILVSFGIGARKPKRLDNNQGIIAFAGQLREFLDVPRSRFAILGASLFWASAATLRVMLLTWAPLVLLSKNASEIAELTVFLAIGIVAGSALVPRLIPLEHLRRARLPAYAMGIMIVLLSVTPEVWSARMILFAIGSAGGMFIVPVNAALQEIGHEGIGAGRAVALQNFFQNVAMLLSVGIYTYADASGVNPVLAMLVLGGLVILATFLVALRLPSNINNQTGL